MKDVYPEFDDQVAFYAVGQDPTEPLALMEEYREQQGYPWPVAETHPRTLVNLKVLQQSTKIAFDSNDVITYRQAHGGDPETWRKVFEGLAATAVQ